MQRRGPRHAMVTSTRGAFVADTAGMSWIGYLGAAAFALAWIPQCLETWRARRCEVNASFLLLNAVGSLSLAAYAAARRDLVFTAINALTSAGALLNLLVKGQGRAKNL
jgi:lipid-A-disaccharide synthase-like uncharacterized protein